MESTSRIFDQARPRRKTSIELFQYADQFASYVEGDVIFREGQVGDCMYVVKAGSVDLFIGDRLVERVEAGQLFGEMALLDCPIRSASAVASSDCQLVPIKEDEFNRLLNSSPYFGKEVLETMATRLRHMDSTLRVMHEREKRVRTALEGEAAPKVARRR